MKWSLKLGSGFMVGLVALASQPVFAADQHASGSAASSSRAEAAPAPERGMLLVGRLPDPAETLKSAQQPVFIGYGGPMRNLDHGNAAALKTSLRFIQNYILAADAYCVKDPGRAPQSFSTALLLSFLREQLSDLEHGTRLDGSKTYVQVDPQKIGQAIFALRSFLKRETELFGNRLSAATRENDSKLEDALKAVGNAFGVADPVDGRYELAPGGTYLKRALEDLETNSQTPCTLDYALNAPATTAAAAPVTSPSIAPVAAPQPVMPATMPFPALTNVNLGVNQDPLANLTPRFGRDFRPLRDRARVNERRPLFPRLRSFFDRLLGRSPRDAREREDRRTGDDFPRTRAEVLSQLMRRAGLNQ